MRMQPRTFRLASALTLSLLVSAAFAAGPVRKGNLFVFPDGMQVRAASPAGQWGVIQADGSIRWADGTRVSHDSVSGKTVVVHPDGRRDVSNSHAAPYNGIHAAPVFLTPAPRAGAPGKPGYVEGGRPQAGANASVGAGNVNARFAQPAQGGKPSQRVVPSRDRNGNFVYSDGARVRGYDPSGNPGKVDANGVIHYSDGTQASNDPASGQTKYVSPGGVVRVVPRGAPSRDGNGNFVYSDGARVRGYDPSGNPGKVDANGVIHYSDGTQASHDPASGDTKYVSPGGVVRVVPRGAPSVDADGNFSYSDGARLRGTDPSGTRGKVGANGVISYSDGTQASHDPIGGDTKYVSPGGQVRVVPRGTPTIGSNGDFVYSDGVRIRGVDPSGTAGKIGSNGVISYSDGTRASHDVIGGDTKIVRPDGSVVVTPRGGPSRNDDGNFEYSDGTQIRGSDPSGNPGIVGSNGVISFSDGTRASHDNDSGDTKFVAPDGTVRVINVGNGTDVTYPAGGGSHQNGGFAAGGNTSGNNSNDDESGHPGNGETGKNTGTTASNNSNNTSNNNSNNDDESHQNDDGSSSDAEGSEGASEEPDKEPAKGENEGMQVADDGRGGGPNPFVPAGQNTNLSIGSTSTDPAPDDTRSHGTPTLLAPGRFGPGGRPTEAGSYTPGGGPLLRLPAGSLVINPDPSRMTGPARPTVIDPFGGRR